VFVLVSDVVARGSAVIAEGVVVRTAVLPVACNSAALVKQVEGRPDMSASGSNRETGEQQVAATGLVRDAPLRSGSRFAGVTGGGLRGFSLRL
jgi:hypothetical protein